MEFVIRDKSLIVPAGVTEICYQDICDVVDGFELEEICLPSTIRKIHHNTFFDFSTIKRICLPSDLQYIGAQAFWGLDELEEITLPCTVLFVGKHAFCNCPKLILTIAGATERPMGWDKEFAANIKQIIFQG